MNANDLNQYLTQGAQEGFSEIVAPLTAFSYVVKPGACALNDTVRVPFAQNVSASGDFTYETGYATSGNSVTGKSVTLSTLKYQKIALSDSDLVLLNPESIVRLGRQAGNRLAADFIGAVFTNTLTQANFAASGSATYDQFSSSAAVASLDKAVNDAKWPVGERSLICGTSLWQSLMNNPSVINAQNYGSSEPVQMGRLKSLLGFAPYVTTVTIPNSAKGFAVNPSAVLVGNAYHAPQDAGSQYIAANQIVLENGLTIGFRQFYVPEKGTSVRVFDVLGGSGVGNSTGLYWIK